MDIEAYRKPACDMHSRRHVGQLLCSVCAAVFQLARHLIERPVYCVLDTMYPVVVKIFWLFIM